MFSRSSITEAVNRVETSTLSEDQIPLESEFQQVFSPRSSDCGFGRIDLAQLSELFDHADTDKSGEIDREEFVKARARPTICTRFSFVPQYPLFVEALCDRAVTAWHESRR